MVNLYDVKCCLSFSAMKKIKGLVSASVQNVAELHLQSQVEQK